MYKYNFSDAYKAQQFTTNILSYYLHYYVNLYF